MEPATIPTLGPVAQAKAIFTANAALPIEERKARKEVIAACVEAGINKATASTQYGKFHSSEGGPKVERTGSVAGVRAIIAEHYGVKLRKEILALCVEAGFNPATSSTQYGKFHQEVSSKLPAVVPSEPEKPAKKDKSAGKA